MADYSPTLLLQAGDTEGSPRSITTSSSATFYLVKNRSANVPVFARAVAGGDNGSWVRIRPHSQGVIENGGAAITALEFFLKETPRYVDRNGNVTLAQAARVDIERH